MSQNITSYAFAAFIIMFIVHMLFNKKEQVIEPVKNSKIEQLTVKQLVKPRNKNKNRVLTNKNNNRCPKPVKQFHKEFFDFRGYTNINSSIHIDPVDKLQNLTFNGGCSNVKVKDLYDSLTQNVEI